MCGHLSTGIYGRCEDCFEQVYEYDPTLYRAPTVPTYSPQADVVAEAKQLSAKWDAVFGRCVTRPERRERIR